MPQPAKSPLVLIHGFPLDRRIWDGCVAALSSRAVCHAIDLPGFGENKMPAESMADYAEYIACYIQETIGGPAFVAGLSMGGYVALELLARSPELVRGLALVDTKIVADNDAQKANRDRMISVARSGPEGIVREMLPNMTAPGMGERRAADWQKLQSIMGSVSAGAMIAALGAMRDRRDHTDTVATAKVPILALVGELDAITPVACADVVLAANPKAEKVVITGAGHMAPIEAPQAVAEALGNWLTKAARP